MTPYSHHQQHHPQHPTLLPSSSAAGGGGQLDTSSFAMAEFFSSHDQSVWPLSIQNEDIDQEAVNLIACAMQLNGFPPA